MTDVIEAVRRHDEAFDAHDPAARTASEAEDIEFVMPGGMTLRGHEQTLGVVSAFWEGIPDVKVTPENYFVAGDTVAVEGTMTGTHTGTLRGPQGEIPPSGNRISVRYAAFKTIRGDKVASERLYFDQLEFLQQIGALPSPGSLSSASN